MLLSNTYRQSSENPAVTKIRKDPDNRLLWRFNRQRLEAEAIRDSILVCQRASESGARRTQRFPALPADLADFARYGRTGGLMWEPNEKEEDGRRRSVYIFQRRSLPLPMMASFDAIVFSESCERRSVTTTPLQALSMMNGDLIHEESALPGEPGRKGSRAGAPRPGAARCSKSRLNRPPKPDELETFHQIQRPARRASAACC